MKRWFFAAVLGVLAPSAMITGSAAQAQASGQPKVAVYNFTDPQGSGLAPQLSEMIRTAIVNSKKFTVISRDMTIAEEEAQLAKAGKTKGAKTKAKVEPVDYAIEGSITSAQLTQKKNFFGEAADKLLLGGQGIAGGCVSGTFSVSIDVRVKDLSTGETPYAGSLTRTLESECSRSGGAVDFPVVMRGIADELAKEFATRIYPIKIIAVQADGGLMLNYGDSVLTPGTFMKVFGPGDEVFSDGVKLKIDGPLLARAQITDVTPQTARAVVEGEVAELPPVGSLLRVDTDQKPAKPVKKKKGR